MIFSILAFVALIISICIKERKKSLVVQSINCLLEAIYNFIISAYTGAVLSVINFIRTFLFINKGKFNKIIYLVILFVFEGGIIINCIMTWGGYISILPTIRRHPPDRRRPGGHGPGPAGAQPAGGGEQIRPAPGRVVSYTVPV